MVNSYWKCIVKKYTAAFIWISFHFNSTSFKFKLQFCLLLQIKFRNWIGKFRDPQFSSEWSTTLLFTHILKPKTLCDSVQMQLLCRIPTRRLRCLEHFQSQKFFHGMSFDSQLLQKRPIKPILELKNHPDRSERSMRGLSSDLLKNFECDLLNSPSTPVDLPPTLMKIEVNEDTAGTETKATGTSSPWKHKWTNFAYMLRFAKDKIKCHSIFL